MSDMLDRQPRQWLQIRIVQVFRIIVAEVNAG
jgi:hypothetical protein